MVEELLEENGRLEGKSYDAEQKQKEAEQKQKEMKDERETMNGEIEEQRQSNWRRCEDKEEREAAKHAEQRESSQTRDLRGVNPGGRKR